MLDINFLPSYLILLNEVVVTWDYMHMLLGLRDILGKFT